MPAVHQEKTAGAICVFNLTRLEAALPEEGGLLIAGDSGNRYPVALNVAVTVDFAAVAHIRQAGGRDVKDFQQLFVPAQVPDVVKHGA